MVNSTEILQNLSYKVQSSRSQSLKAIQKLKRFLNISAIMDQLSCYYAWRHRRQVNIVINFLWRSSDRIAEFVARSFHNPEVSCSSVTHAICKNFFPLINGDIWLASEFHTCFFSSSLLLSNWSKLNFSYIFHNNIYWFLTLPWAGHINPTARNRHV